jgi:AraC-like DNA-binding protein
VCKIVRVSYDLLFGRDSVCVHWVAFDGRLSEKFKELDHVFSLSSKITQEMLECDGMDLLEYRITELLYKLYIELFGGKAKRHHYTSRVEGHIRAAYMYPLRVEDIARDLNLDRHYLARIFKEKTGKTISEYIISVRMEEAKNYLKQDFSVEDTARLCGYKDVSNFSKLFIREKCRIRRAACKRNNRRVCHKLEHFTNSRRFQTFYSV